MDGGGGSDDFGNDSLSRLSLLGTVHLDPDGPSRLTRFLTRFAPDLILLEFSPFALRYRKSHRHRLIKRMSRNLRLAARRIGMPPSRARSHPEVQFVRRQIAFPFEYLSAERYARRNGVRLLLVDRSEFSRTLIASWAESISMENLATLLTLAGDRPSVAGLYESAARRIVSCTPDPTISFTAFGATDRAAWEKREVHLYEKIFAALSLHLPRRPLYVGGCLHLSCGRGLQTVRELLAVPLDRCFLLDRGPLSQSPPRAG